MEKLINIGTMDFPFSKLPVSIRRCPDLSIAAKMLYSVLIQFAGKTGHCWPSRATLAMEMAVTTEYIHKLLKELKAYNLIKVVPPTNIQKKKHWNTSYYFYNHPLYNKTISEEDNTVLSEQDVSMENVGHIRMNNSSNTTNDSYYTTNDSTPLRNRIYKKNYLKSVSKETHTEPEGSGFVQEPPGSNEHMLLVKRNNRQPDPTLSDHASNIISHWHSINVAGQYLRRHKEATKTYERIKLAVDQLVAGTFFKNKDRIPASFRDRQFRLGEIRVAMDRFAQSAMLVDYEPSSLTLKDRKRKTGMLEFFYNAMSQSESLEWISPLLFYFDQEPRRCSERNFATIDKDNPAVQVLVSNFKKLAKINGNELSPRQYKDLSFAVKQLEEKLPYYRDNIRNFDYWKQVHQVKSDVSLLALFLAEAVEDEIKGSSMTINTGWFCSETAINTRLPKYLKETNFLKG